MVDACAWKSGSNLVPQDQIECLLSLLLKAEERKWLVGISPVSSAEHEDLQPAEWTQNRNGSFGDVGSLLLSHGKFITRIHSRFHDYEPCHYCLQVTANSTNPDRPSSQMKVVSSDDSNTSSFGPGRNPSSSTLSTISQETAGDIKAKGALFELYKNAVLCAQLPVLSQAASPNSPYSPVSSPSSLQRKFSFSRLSSSSSASGGAKLNSNRRGMPSLSDAECMDHEVAESISSDVLQELVMNAFGLVRKVHKFLCETEIPKKVPRAKDRQRFLVEELQSRLVVLECNHHPFYRVNAFMDKNAYSEWVIVEKEKIEGLIRIFCHDYARPPVCELPLESPEYHKQYVDLMKRLVRYESKDKELHPVYGGAIPTAPLSSSACRLLKEFELRYGVGSLFCKISYLEYLVKYFENKLWYIEHIIVSLRDVMEHVFICQEIFVAEEFKMLLSILSSLLATTKYSLTRIRRIFPAENSPRDGVPALVALYELSLESARQLQSEFPWVFSESVLPQARQFANSLATEPVCDLLASYLKEEMVGRYERIKVIATDEIGEIFSLPKLLLKLILEIHHEVNYYSTSYKKAFSRYFDMTELAAVKFYSLLMSDVEQLCGNPPRTQRRDSVEPFMLCLAFRLSELDKKWSNYIPHSHQTWRQPFQEFALQWLDAIGHYFRTLVPQLVSHDEWNAVEVNVSEAQERTHQMRPGRLTTPGSLGRKSASLPSLTPSKHSAFKTVGSSYGTPSKSTASKGVRGKEPLHSRKICLGSSPKTGVNSRKRRLPGLPSDSSLDEETATSVWRNTTKSGNTQQVVVQIHFPRAQANPEIVEHHPSSQGESSEEESPKSVLVDSDEHKEQCFSSLEKTSDTGKSRSYYATAQDSNNSNRTMEEAIQTKKDEGNARGDEVNEKESITLDQQASEDLTTVKASDNLENTKPGTSKLENDKPQDDDKFITEKCEDHTDKREQIQCVSKVKDSEGKGLKKPALSEQSENDGVALEENGAVKRLENCKNSEDAGSSASLNNSEEVKGYTVPATEQLDSSTEKNEVKNSGLTTKEESNVVKGLENGHHPESAQSRGSLCPSAESENNTRLNVDQLGGNTEENKVECSGSSMTVPNCVVQPHENGESSVPTITQETGGLHPGYETKPGVAQLNGFDKTENHIEPLVDQLIEDTEKVEGERCASILTDSALTVKQDFIESDGDLFHEGDFSSDCSSHSKASESRNQSTSFENDTNDESHSDGSIHTSDSFNFIEDEGKTKMSQSKAISGDGAFAASTSVPDRGSSEQQQRKGSGKEPSKLRSSPKLGFRAIVPVIEDEGIRISGHDGSDRRNSCRTCPASQSCLATEDKGKQDVRRQGVYEDKQSKVLQQRPSTPVKIPVPQNRLLAKLRDTAPSSPGSKWSECGSFVSAFGSIPSGRSVESFHTARSSGTALQSPGTSSSGGSDHDTESIHSSDDKPHVLPISSSFVDVICAVNRLTAFACHLCKILCPDETSQSAEQAATAFSASTDEDLKNESLGIKRRLYHKFIQVMLSFVGLYSDNVLGIETCGLPDELLIEILGERVQRHLRTLRDSGHLQGCRYNPFTRQCCNTRDNTGTFRPPCEGILRTAMNPGEFEPLTEQMAVRMSNVAILRNILSWLVDHVTSAISNPNSMLSDHHYRLVSSPENELSLSYCEHGPSLDGIPSTCTAEGRRDVPQPETDVLREPATLNSYSEHICRLEISQVKLVIYRINKLFKQVLRSLLDLRLRRFSIRRRLTPAIEILSRELQRFHGVLYPESFNRFLTGLWTAVAQNLEEESHLLVRRRSSASEQSQLLLQAVAYLMQFFYGGGHGLAYDTLSAPMDRAMQYLQLYTNPTDRLISMYHSLYKQLLIAQKQFGNDEFVSSVSVSSHNATANAPADFVIQAMLKDLHATRKCFSGAALVEWMENYVRHDGYDNLGVCIGSTETETGLEFGQYLLERGMIICVSPPPRFDRQPSTGRRRQSQGHPENTPTERGKVFVNEDVQRGTRVNNIEFTTRSNRSSPTSSSRQTPRSTRTDSYDSDEDADDECDDDGDDFLGSVSDVWSRINSVRSERDASFYNHPKAFYKFISEEDSSRTEVKITLGITDRLNLPDRLKHILCVLYARRDSDKAARIFLRKLPRGLLDDAVGTAVVKCYPLNEICQTL